MNSIRKVVSLGDRKYRLEAPSGQPVGWIHGHAIGLSGFRDEQDVLTRVPALRGALDDTLERRYSGRYRPVRDFANLRLVHDGAYEWIAAGNVPIARVLRSTSGRADGSVALEFVLPSYASERAAIACADVLVTMLHEQSLSPLLIYDTEESSHVATAESFESSPGQRERRRRQRVARQLSSQ